MELRLLRYFLAVARENSFTRAAHYLHVTQPTLSRQMMDLEEELGQKLLNRETHHITLTPEGMLLRRRAEEIMALVQKTPSVKTSPATSISAAGRVRRWIWLQMRSPNFMRIIPVSAGTCTPESPAM